MTITVLFLGPARDLAGMEHTSMSVQDGATASSLRPLIAEKFPKIGAAFRTMRVAVNQSFVSEEFELGEGDEVALIPPVSGG